MSWLNWLARFARPAQKRSGPGLRRWVRPGVEQLETRLVPATFAGVGTQLNLDFNVATTSVAIVSAGTSYSLTLTGDTWSGADSANVTGNGTAALLVTTAGLAAFNTVNLTDSAAGIAVNFNDSGTHNYTNNFTVALSNPAAGPSTFDGSSNFGTSILQVATEGSIFIGAGAALSSSTGDITLASDGTNTALNANGSVISQNGNVTLQATGDLIVGANQTISSGSGALTLGADLTAAGAGDDGIGTLSINAGAAIYGANITLLGRTRTSHPPPLSAARWPHRGPTSPG